jgi:hypothetical protein
MITEALTITAQLAAVATLSLFAAWAAVKTCEMLSALFLRIVRAPFFAIKLFRFVERNNRLVVRKVSGEYEVKLINCSLLDLAAVVGAFAKHAQKEDVEAAIKLGFREAGKESD